MSFKLPSTQQLRKSGEKLGMDLSEEYSNEIREYIKPFIEAYNLIGSLPDYLPEVKYKRTPGYRPEGIENKYGAWYIKTPIEGSKRGKLVGKT